MSSAVFAVGLLAAVEVLRGGGWAELLLCIYQCIAPFLSRSDVRQREGWGWGRERKVSCIVCFVDCIDDCGDACVYIDVSELRHWKPSIMSYR